MTIDGFLKDFEKTLYQSFNTNKLRSPYDTGKLRYQAFKIAKKPNGWKIYVDLTVSEYAQYLDGFDSIKARYPEGWFDHIAYKIVQDLMKKYDKQQYESDEIQEGFKDIEAIRQLKKSDQALLKGATYGKSAKSQPQYVLGKHTNVKSVKSNVIQHQQNQATYLGYKYIP